VNRFTSCVYYQYNGPSRVDPFRTEKSAEEVERALMLFPLDLEHSLLQGSTVETPQDLAAPGSSYVTVVTPGDETQADAVVKRCLGTLDLFAEKIKDR
jgi:hypothetical protein